MVAMETSSQNNTHEEKEPKSIMKKLFIWDETKRQLDNSTRQVCSNYITKRPPVEFSDSHCDAVVLKVKLPIFRTNLWLHS